MIQCNTCIKKTTINFHYCYYLILYKIRREKYFGHNRIVRLLYYISYLIIIIYKMHFIIIDILKINYKSFKCLFNSINRGQ